MLRSILSQRFRQRNNEILEILRNLRTQCVSYLPRGSVSFVRRRINHAGEAEVESDALARELEAKAHRDLRPIDTIDPVILKYTNFINDIRDGEHVQEKVYMTNFGSIRFDNENVPSVHGQYDSTYGPDMKVLLEKKLSQADIKGEELNNEVDNESPSETEIASHTSTPATHQVGLSVSQSTFQEGKEAYISSSSNSSALNDNDGINYIDDLYFGTAVERHSQTRDNQGEEINKMIRTSTAHASDLNYIDECVFGSAVSRHNDGDNRNVNASQKPIHIDSEQFNVKQKSLEDGDLGYIDKVYFQDSSETLSENGEVAAEIPEVDNNLTSRTKSKDTETITESCLRKVLKKNSTPAVESYMIGKSEEEEAPHIHVVKAQEKTIPNSPAADTLPKSAYEFVIKKRKELHEESHGMDTVHGGKGRRGVNKILSLLNIQKKENCTKYEISKLLKKSVIYDRYDVVGLYKPYGMSVHGGPNSPYHVLLDYLPELARHLNVEKLYPVHRLDANTTGVLLMARTPAMADTLKEMFKEQQLKKTYWAITKGIPSPLQGVIDIPVAEGVIDGRRRMILTPNVEGIKTFARNSHMAVTTFRVLAKSNSAAFVELLPMTGVKHQLRVHLGFGLSCPVLGDHKYSHLRKLAPQRLPGDILDHLMLKQSKVRELPMFLHSRSILLPEIVDGRNITIEAKLPAFFNKALSYLGLNRNVNQIRYDGYRSLD
ncbi:uncharacterized protein [Panulirus ornatus]|uniref:uncharacterized protein isoform X1 n=1 Tax=Panulirus ornatus TaxID=150431 RepID=UPI003A87B063